MFFWKNGVHNSSTDPVMCTICAKHTGAVLVAPKTLLKIVCLLEASLFTFSLFVICGKGLSTINCRLPRKQQ